MRASATEAAVGIGTCLGGTPLGVEVTADVCSIRCAGMTLRRENGECSASGGTPAVTKGSPGDSGVVTKPAVGEAASKQVDVSAVSAEILIGCSQLADDDVIQHGGKGVLASGGKDQALVRKQFLRLLRVVRNTSGCIDCPGLEPRG